MNQLNVINLTATFTIMMKPLAIKQYVCKENVSGFSYASEKLSIGMSFFILLLLLLHSIQNLMYFFHAFYVCIKIIQMTCLESLPWPCVRN